MKTYSARNLSEQVVASCRFDRQGHPPPSCQFHVCMVYDGERMHMHLESMPYPRGGEVKNHGKSSCNGYECKGWYVVKDKVSLKGVES